MLKTFIFLLLISVTLISDSIERTQVIMGTFISISLPSSQNKHFNHVFDIMKEVDASLSSYKKTSIVTKLNSSKKANLDQLTFEALTLSEKYFSQTNGYFDITVGSITKDLYHFGEDERVPTHDELNEAKVGFKGLRFTQQSATLDKSLKIDLGGMGKGFGVDKVAEYLKEQNITKTIIAASGDIRCFGECKIDVANPLKQDASIISFRTSKKNTAISTSGNYNRYVKSVKNNHLINPKEKKSQTNFISITLLSCKNNSDLDAYATAVSVMPKKEAYEFLNKHDLAYIIMESDKKIYLSNNILEYVKDLVFHY